MAESKRRGEEAVDEPLDDEVIVASDDDDTFASDDDFTDDEDDASTNGAGSRRSRSAVAKSTTSARGVKSAKSDKIKDDRIGFGARIARFIREVVAEMRKVNWPSRKELLTYTSVVIVFVVIMMSIVGGLDYVFAWAVSHVFAGK